MIRFHRFSFLVFGIVLSVLPAIHGETVVFDASAPESTDVAVVANRIAVERKDGLLLITNKIKTDWPDLTFKGKWSLEPNDVLVLELENRGGNNARVSCRLDSTGTNPDKGIKTSTKNVTLAPGEKKRWEVSFPNGLPPRLRDKLFAMRGYPGGAVGDKDGKVGVNAFDPSDLVAVHVFYAKPTEEHTVGIKRIYAAPGTTKKIVSKNAALELPPEKFFPMIDKYGQYVHADWPDKIKSDADLRRRRETEDAELAATPEPTDRNRFGGWAKGPQRKATGRFYVEKLDGVWWLVDPEGRLFWSHGVDCVRWTTGDTPITDREFYFTEFPFPEFVGRGGWAVHGHYVGKTPYKTYNFTASNLSMKYGEDWKRLFAETTQRRLRAWGMNTIANWSEPAIFNLRRTPYVATLGTSGPDIAGSEGYWGRFRDPFHPSFRKHFAETVAKNKAIVDDPWCIGVFVDNELGWGDDTSLAVAAMISPATQPAKIALIDMLRKKYERIDNLNVAWKTSFADWDALTASVEKPDLKNKAVAADLRDGYSLIAEEYFSAIRGELKIAAPETLYLGCRFAWANDAAVRAAGKYCDVIGFNVYAYDWADFKLPEGVDKPVIGGEFHFGALDRGPFHPGLRPTADQQGRAEAYEKYVRSALTHPNVVGTHWFQYGDQATTGRGGDGENYQIGLVDVCDTPYRETIDAVKRVGDVMYDLRAAKRPER